MIFLNYNAMNTIVMGSPGGGVTHRPLVIINPQWKHYKILFKERKNHMDNKKSMKLILSIDEDNKITMFAQKCGLSKNAYIKKMALNGEISNSLQEAKARGILSQIYILAEQTDDPAISEILKRGADEIWQYLK